MCTSWCCWLPWASLPASAPSQMPPSSWSSMASLLSTSQVSWCVLLCVCLSPCCVCCCITAVFFSGFRVRVALPMLCTDHALVLATASCCTLLPHCCALRMLLCLLLQDCCLLFELYGVSYCCVVSGVLLRRCLLLGRGGIFRCLPAVYFTSPTCVPHTSVPLALDNKASTQCGSCSCHDVQLEPSTVNMA